MDRHDVYTADECFLTGTAAEVIPWSSATAASSARASPGPITRELRQRFQRLVREER